MTALTNIVRKELRELLGRRLRKLVLFGSRARGDYNDDSDTDVAVVVDDLDRVSKEHILQMIAELELEHLYPISALVIDSKEYARLLKSERRLALDIEREGVPL